MLRIGSKDWVEQGKILRGKLLREDRGGVLCCSVNIYSFFLKRTGQFGRE